MLQYAVPPGYQRQQPIRRPKLGPWLGVIDAILEDDKQRPAKQRHTAKRIFERLKEEHGFTGGYTIVKDYVRSAELHSREMFIPLTHAPGEAQADFGEALVVVAGVEQKAHYLAMDLPHSDDCFVAAFPAETTEAFLEGHVRAFAYFGGVPTRILSQRYERGSTMVTSNLPFQEWTEVLGSERLTGALLDRLTLHVHILEMNADSYRLKQSRRKRTTSSER
jgi:transposase